ncbi:unnamed protein product, partial [Didymodactylos carnosus]
MAQLVTSITASQTIVRAEDEDTFEEYEDCIGENALEAVESEKDSEIVCLRPLHESKWELKAGYAFEKHWRCATENNEMTLTGLVFVISFLGNTTAGKSFISKHFFDENEQKPWTSAESDNLGSTTSNINCFECQKVNKMTSKTLLLDFEGENGTSTPLMLRFRHYLSHKKTVNALKRLLDRSKAVSEYFPKLAYILSNVVVYVGREDIVVSEYLKRCCEFAQRANEGVSQVVYRPVLIIIQNQSSLGKTFGIMKVTEEFKAIHKDNEKLRELEKYFSEIFCMRLPHTEIVQKVKGGTNIDGEVVFNEQIAELKEKLIDIDKKSKQQLITHSQWLYLLDRVLDIVSSGRSVSIHNLLSE